MQGANPAYQRILQRMDERDDANIARQEAAYARIEHRLNTIELNGLKDRGQLASDIEELRRDVGELRDAGTLVADKAAKVVVETTIPAVERAASKTKWWQKWQAYAVAFVAFVAFYKNIGTFMRDATAWWDWVIDRPPAEIRPHDEVKK